MSARPDPTRGRRVAKRAHITKNRRFREKELLTSQNTTYTMNIRKEYNIYEKDITRTTRRNIKTIRGLKQSNRIYKKSKV